MSNKYRYEIVKQQVDGVMYLSKYLHLKKVGMIYKALCPFHGEKTPSFTVYPPGHVTNGKKQNYTSFYCFGCAVGGDIINFKQLKEGLQTKEEACYELEKEIGLVIDDDSAHKTYLEEQLNYMKNSQGNILSITEVNLVCSSICRNYLLWVRDYYSKSWETEIKTIEKFYKYFDQTLPERTAIEATTLIQEVEEKIRKRRILLKEGICCESGKSR
jgi:hypothetical protein